jgi:hypothetical protein
MKRLIILMVAMVAMNGVNAQGCLPSGITFSTQQQIDNFQANYPGCTIIEGSATISGGDIVNLSGLNVLTAVEGTFSISYNPVLINLTGLEMLGEVGNSFIIGNNGDLQSLSALESLTNIGYDFKIGNNPNLTSIVTSGQLQQIYGSLEIHSNTSLSSLAGFESLLSVGAISIISNPLLSNIDGLENIDGSSMISLEISYNPNLSVCDIQSICDYIAMPGAIVNIENNAPGCNSPEEVNAACTFSIEQIGLDDEIFIYPNPAGKTVTISGIDARAIREILIYNQTGQKVQQGKPVNNTLNISKLRPGMYIVELVTDQGKMRKKLIVE